MQNRKVSISEGGAREAKLSPIQASKEEKVNRSSIPTKLNAKFKIVQLSIEAFFVCEARHYEA